jgi:glutathione S-transferase
MSAVRRLYDLAGAQPERRFSPYCWRTKMALAHKGLDAETIPWRFTEKDAIAFSGQGRVPVLVDGEHVVSDSWAIAKYLEEAYPDRPSLFGGAAAIPLARFINWWADMQLIVPLLRLIAADIHDHLDEKDRAYFRETREKRLKATLEQAAANRETAVAEFRQSLDPLRYMLRDQPFIGGETPRYADYIVFGPFQWARCTSPFKLLAADDPIAAWRARLLDAFDGLPRKAVGYEA